MATPVKFELLTAAGCCSLVAAAAHVGIVLGGAHWYRFFGAGESMARMADEGMLKPSIITLGIAAVLATWSAYAFSGAGQLPRLPLLKPALALITIIYLVRGVGGLIAPFVIDHPALSQNSSAFWIWSSAICLAIGVVHLLGLIDAWPEVL